MPFIYESSTKQGAENLATNSSGNTEVDWFFLKPGATRPAAIVAMRVQGKGNALTALTGISIRLKQFTSTASVTTTGCAATTPAPKNKLAPVCVATAGMSTNTSSSISSGTGGPVIVGYASMGASGPGGWVAINPDDVPLLDGNANMSMDAFSSSPTASMNFEAVIDNSEAGT